MAASSPRQLMILGVLGVVLVGVLYYELAPGDDPPARPSRPRAERPRAEGRRTNCGGSGAAGRAEAGAAGAGRGRPGPVHVRGTADCQVAGGAGPDAGPQPTAPTPVAELQGPPPAPPITLRFIGILNAASTSKIAVLSDGKGNVFYGREGETIDGRYRIDRIGVESIDMAWTDGRGHQVIRLSGS